MGKRLEDLKLRNEPIEEPDPRSTEWYQFLEEIDELSGRAGWARETLDAIAETVQRIKMVTPGQRRSIENIAAAADRQPGRSRRYEGFGRDGR